MTTPTNSHKAWTDERGHVTSNKSSIPQYSTVKILDARSSDSAGAAFSSVLAKRVIVVAATALNQQI